jgi:hypothetical protein
MTTKEAIALGLRRVTVTTKESGAPDTYHYFADTINNIQIIVDEDEDGWHLEIMDYHCKFYTYESAKQLLDIIRVYGKRY